MARYTQQEKDYILGNYLTTSMLQMAKHLGREYSGLKNHVKKIMKLEIPEETRKAIIEKSLNLLKDHQFKPGHIPKTKLEDGHITLWKDMNNKRYYKWIVIGGKWMQLSHYNWKNAGFEIPKGYILAFKNGDTLNCDPENLELITRAESVVRNFKNRRTAAENKIQQKLYSDQAKAFRKEQRAKDKADRLAAQKQNHREERSTAHKLKEEQRIANMQQRRREKTEGLQKAKRDKKIKLEQERATRREERKLRSVMAANERRWSQKTLSESKIKLPNVDGLPTLRIDHKTFVYLKPGADKNAVLEMYSKKSAVV